MWNRRHRWLRRLAAGFAFAGLVVPTAANADPIDFAKDGVNALPSVEYNGYGYQRSPGVPLADQKSGIEWVTNNGHVLKDGMWVKAADSGIEWVTNNGHVLKDGMWVKAADSEIRFFDRGDYVSQPQVANAGIRFFGDYVSQPSGTTVAVRPDDRAVRIAPQPIDATNVVRPDDRSVRFTPSGGELPQVVAAPSTGFDWNDAGIGAGVALGLMLLALGAALATRHGNRKALASA